MAATEMRNNVATLSFQHNKIEAIIKPEGATTLRQNSSPNNPLQLGELDQ
jgi:hypothetical protein